MTPPDVTLSKESNLEKNKEYADICRYYPALTVEMQSTKQTIHCLGIQIYVVKE